MDLVQVISLANRKVELRFRAMVRSLRATGCDLPVKVIPYDDSQFDLPDGCEWLVNETLFDFLRSHHARPVLRKYACLTQENYQFVDSDVAFLRDPREALRGVSGFVTSCGNWRDPAHTLTEQLEREWAARTTMWQWRLFNSGQFACDRALYSLDSLLTELRESSGHSTILGNPYHEQPGMNLLICRSGVPVTNLTLPPHNMESTWAGDYPGAFERFWTSPKVLPYLIHWAGLGHSTQSAIDELYLKHMENDERLSWSAECVAAEQRVTTTRWQWGYLKARIGKTYRAARQIWGAP